MNNITNYNGLGGAKKREIIMGIYGGE